jgi:hypothetical protein
MPSADKNRFLESLDEKVVDASDEMNALDERTIDGGIDPTLNTPFFDIEFYNGSELMQQIEIDTFGENLVHAIADESERIFEKADLQTYREEEQLLQVSGIAMTNALERVSIIMNSFEGNRITTEVQAVEFWQRAANLIRDIDEQDLMKQSAKEAGSNGDLVRAFYETVGEHIPEDYTAVVERILADDLDPHDRLFIADAIKNMSARSLSDIFSESTKIIQGSQLGLLLMNLKENPEELANVMDIVVERPGGPAAVMYMTVGGYLTVAESESMIEGELQRETDPVRREAFEEVLDFILGDTMTSVTEDRVAVQREIADRMPYILGHKNQAAAKLSYRGIIGTYMQLVAVMGLTMTVIANREHPIRGILANPMVAATLAIGSAGAALDPSDIGMWPKPGTHLTKALRDSDEWDEAKEEEAFGNFKTNMLNHPIEAELYYNVNDRIADEARAQINDGAAVGDIEITMDNIGLDFDQLPDRFQSVSKEKTEARFTDWVQTFMYDEGLNLDSASQQTRYMNEARDEHPLLNGDWGTYSLTSALR